MVYGSSDNSNIIMFDSGVTNSRLVIKDLSIKSINTNKSFIQIFGKKTNIDIKSLHVKMDSDCNSSIIEFNSLNVS